VPIAHVEAGLRSFDNTMPEEINRRLTDQLCSLLFVTSPEAIAYLANEGIACDGVHFVGNTLIDALVTCLDKLDAEAASNAHGLPERYMVATLHRPFNVDSPEAAALLVKAMHQVADKAPVIMPVHPRGRAAFEGAGLAEHLGIRMCEPLGYLEFMSLVRGSAAAITDSAGVQEETTFLRVPCLTPAPGDRADSHRHQRQQPARPRGRAGGRGPGRPGPGTICWGSAAVVGRRVRLSNRPHYRRVACYPILTIQCAADSYSWVWRPVSPETDTRNRRLGP